MDDIVREMEEYVTSGWARTKSAPLHVIVVANDHNEIIGVTHPNDFDDDLRAFVRERSRATNARAVAIVAEAWMEREGSGIMEEILMLAIETRTTRILRVWKIGPERSITRFMPAEMLHSFDGRMTGLMDPGLRAN